ncbi:MAG: hypothetical protein ACJAYB_000838, partial [Psychromonas sp.]
SGGISYTFASTGRETPWKVDLSLKYYCVNHPLMSASNWGIALGRV